MMRTNLGNASNAFGPRPAKSVGRLSLCKLSNVSRTVSAKGTCLKPVKIGSHITWTANICFEKNLKRSGLRHASVFMKTNVKMQEVSNLTVSSFGTCDLWFERLQKIAAVTLIFGLTC